MSGPLTLAGASLVELERSIPWTRWLARVAGVQIAVGLGGAILKAAPATIIAALVSAFISFLYIKVLLRHTAAAERLRIDPKNAVTAVLDAQASYFRITGILAIVVLAFFGVAIIAGVLIGLTGART